MKSLWDEVVAEPRLERMLAFPRERHGIVAETERRVLDEKLQPSPKIDARTQLELILNDVCFHEGQRFRTSGRLGDEDKKLRARFSRLRKGLTRMSDAELRDELRGLVHWYVSDIVGNFNPAIYAVATRIIPVGLSLLFSPFQLGRSLTDLSQLRERVLIEGQIADLARLARRGTLVVVPTHLSNLDSIVIGFALERAGLPPCTYGAGKNLWSNPLLGFFMRNLGAYRVDRRIKHDLYKETLKTYSTVLLERGYHSLFFPGGTRSRSGALEAHLKLGLAGTALRASINMLARDGKGAGGDSVDGARPGVRPIYFVPVTINYPLVLEAATLVDDFLKETGKNRYIIEDDESAQVGRVARYMKDLLGAQGAMVIQFGQPLDVLGHRVGPDGASYDDRGRPVALRPFLTVGGAVRPDAARDAEYTRELGEKIADAFRRDTHVLSTHVVGWVLHNMLVKAAPGMDLFRLMRGVEPEGRFAVHDVIAAVARVQAALAEQARHGNVRLGPTVRGGDAGAILDEALAWFRRFYDTPIAERVSSSSRAPDGRGSPAGDGDAILVEDRTLCYYYQNRLTSYGLEGLV